MHQMTAPIFHRLSQLRDEYHRLAGLRRCFQELCHRGARLVDCIMYNYTTILFAVGNSHRDRALLLPPPGLWAWNQNLGACVLNFRSSVFTPVSRVLAGRYRILSFPWSNCGLTVVGRLLSLS